MIEKIGELPIDHILRWFKDPPGCWPAVMFQILKDEQNLLWPFARYWAQTLRNQNPGVTPRLIMKFVGIRLNLHMRSGMIIHHTN